MESGGSGSTNNSAWFSRFDPLHKPLEKLTREELSRVNTEIVQPCLAAVGTPEIPADSHGIFAGGVTETSNVAALLALAKACGRFYISVHSATAKPEYFSNRVVVMGISEGDAAELPLANTENDGEIARLASQLLFSYVLKGEASPLITPPATIIRPVPIHPTPVTTAEVEKMSVEKARYAQLTWEKVTSDYSLAPIAKNEKSVCGGLMDAVGVLTMEWFRHMNGYMYTYCDGKTAQAYGIKSTKQDQLPRIAEEILEIFHPAAGVDAVPEAVEESKPKKTKGVKRGRSEEEEKPASVSGAGGAEPKFGPGGPAKILTDLLRAGVTLPKYPRGTPKADIDDFLWSQALNKLATNSIPLSPPIVEQLRELVRNLVATRNCVPFERALYVTEVLGTLELISVGNVMPILGKKPERERDRSIKPGGLTMYQLQMSNQLDAAAAERVLSYPVGPNRDLAGVLVIKPESRVYSVHRALINNRKLRYSDPDEALSLTLDVLTGKDGEPDGELVKYACAIRDFIMTSDVPKRVDPVKVGYMSESGFKRVHSGNLILVPGTVAQAEVTPKTYFQKTPNVKQVLNKIIIVGVAPDDFKGLLVDKGGFEPAKQVTSIMDVSSIGKLFTQSAVLASAITSSRVAGAEPSYVRGTAEGPGGFTATAAFGRAEFSSVRGAGAGAGAGMGGGGGGGGAAAFSRARGEFTSPTMDAVYHGEGEDGDDE